MKPFQMQTFYELLEVPVSATSEQIHRAYDRLISLYADDQVALYGLADSTSAGALRARLLEAMEVLVDDDLRQLYDSELGLPPRSKAPPRTEEDDTPSAQLAMNELLTGADRALQSTHPFVPFSYVDTAPPPVAVTPPPPPPSAPSANVSPPPPMVSPPMPAPPPIAPPAMTPPAPVGQVTMPPPMPSAPPAPRPSPAQAPEMAQSAAIAVAESQLAKVSHAVAAKEARASAPRPKPPELPPDAEFNGELIRRVRTAMELTIQQIADKTRISARHLEAIEADRYASLPAAVYLRGILMNLSRELGLDGIRVAKSYLALVEKAKG